MSPRLLLVGVLLSGLVDVASVASAQNLKLEPEQRYLLLATTKTATMQAELDQAAAQGFRVMAGSPTSNTEMVLFLERVAQPPETYAYKLLATTKTSTMEKELAGAAADGFRLVPQTAISKESVGGKLFGTPREIVVVVERAPKVEKRYEYKLLATTKTSTMQREVSDAVAAGYTLVGLLSRDEHMVIMERAKASGTR